SPIRADKSIGLVVELKRDTNMKDGLMWFCDNCNTKLHDTYFQLKNVEKDFQPRFKEYYNSEEKRTCPECNRVMEVDSRFVD
ncbi:MAG TPA: 3-hydroxyanthranilate 3,4-dioxygenase, partial [Saprospirales bacterium]|nr:3-hydroxyanthranilate 3,4-dioxygenase [Saprospirales bacterium]